MCVRELRAHTIESMLAKVTSTLVGFTKYTVCFLLLTSGLVVCKDSTLLNGRQECNTTTTVKTLHSGSLSQTVRAGE